MPEIEESERARRATPTHETRRHLAAETDRAAREQIAREAEARRAKMARLKEERLATQATEGEGAAPPRKPAKRRAVRRIIVR